MTTTSARRRTRRTATAAAGLAGAAMIALVAAGAGTAAAQPVSEIPFGGSEIQPIPALNPGICPGAIHVTRQGVPTKPGTVRITLTPEGALGSRACPTTIRVRWDNGAFPFEHQIIAGLAGPRVIDAPVGPGVSLLSAGILSPSAVAPTAYVWLQP